MAEESGLTPIAGDARSPAQSLRFTSTRLPPVAWMAIAAIVALVLVAAGVLAQRIGVERLREQGTHKLDLYAASLDSSLAKYEYLPGVVALRPEVIALLRAPANPALVDSVNRYLEAANNEAGSAVLYVLDTRGRGIASSNWSEEESFVGMDLGYRPYVRNAMEKGRARFYGIGTTSGKPGFYFSQAIRDSSGANGEVIGVVTVKVSLDHVESAWSGGEDIALVVDASGVVFLASDVKWKFRTLGSMPVAAAAAIDASRQYAGIRLTPLDLVVDEARAPRIVSAANDGPRHRYLELVHPTPEPTWQLILLSSYTPVATSVRNTVAFAALALGFLLMLALYLHQRQRAIRAALAAKDVLQRAHDELERNVAERTRDLRATNERLGREVTERERAEQVLREAQDGLVQAGKMAVLGQMAAGITHELNQPLAALRTLSDNAHVLLQQDRYDEVRSNLTLISQLTERMGKITGQLKTFARKAPLQLGPVAVRPAIANALGLVARRLESERIDVVQDLPDGDIEVRAEQNRLEQVLVNLIVNALDAMHACATRRLRIAVLELDSANVAIIVSDTGIGIPDNVLARMFEPFVSSKEPGKGLGLGLAISAGIVREFGGSLAAVNLPDGGAQFTIELARIREHAHV